MDAAVTLTRTMNQELGETPVAVKKTKELEEKLLAVKGRRTRNFERLQKKRLMLWRLHDHRFR